MLNIKSKEQLINDIANALEDYSDQEIWCIDLTEQEVVPIPDPMLVGEEFMPDEGHEMINIDRVSSADTFQMMENFTKECTSTGEQFLLNFALEQKHPFSIFRNAVYKLGIEKNWFGYKAHSLRKKAKEWMEENEVDFIDGKVVCNSGKVYTYYRED